MNFEELSFLWKEEPEILKREASKVPEGGCIVEIGTALGGSAGIICDILQNKNISFYTVDKSQSETAKKNLKGKPVNIINSDSASFTEEWQKNIRKSIDLLIIDGDHSFEGIYNDFFGWLPNISENTKLMFHDFDPEERGGIAHFAVHIFLKSLINTGLLKNTEHNYRYLICNIDTEAISKFDNNSIEIYIKTLIDIIFEINKHLKIIKKFSPEKTLEYLSERKNKLDSVSACYIIEYLLGDNFEKLYLKSRTGNDFLFWAEASATYKIAAGDSFIANTFENFDVSTIKDLSKIIAKEQILIIFLKNLLKNFVEWIP